MDHVGRRSRLESRLDDLGVDAFLVTSLPNVRYLSGFRGSNAQLLLGRGDSRFFTDGRYAEQSSHEVPDLRRDLYSGSFTPAFAAACKEIGAVRVGFEAATMSFRTHRELSEEGGVELVPAEDEVESVRWVKDAEEMEHLAVAQAIADDAFDLITGKLSEGMTEKEVALELDAAMRRSGSEGVSFDTIAAFGENSAEPHHSPTGRPLSRGEMVKLDFGAVVQGYHSDMTRTVALGEPGQELRAVYEVVRQAQTRGTEAVKAGRSGGAVDEAAREVIRDAGYGDRFGHSLGHGVGLEVHEGPSLRIDGKDVLPAGSVVTVEPGVYLAGIGGVRIEDMVEVTAGGCRVLPRSPKELIVL